MKKLIITLLVLYALTFSVATIQLEKDELHNNTTEIDGKRVINIKIDKK